MIVHKLYDILCRFISYLMIVILSILTFLSVISSTFVNSADEVYYIGDRGWVHAVVIIVLVFVLSMLYKSQKFRLSDRIVGIILVFMTVLIGVYIYAADLAPRFDQRVVRSVAANLVVGIRDDFLPGGYAELNPQNHGIILFYYLILRIVGYEDYLTIQYVNLGFMVLTVVALYFIARKLTTHYLEVTLGVILFLPYWGYATFLYGNIPGFCLAMWGLYFCMKFMDGQRLADAVAAGLLLAVSVRFKENFSILVMAICIIIICEAILRHRAKYLLLILSMALLLIISKTALNGALASVADYHNPSKGVSSLAFVGMGMHEHAGRGAGWYDGYTVSTYKSAGYDTERSAELARMDISASLDNFLAHPRYMFGFIIRKMSSVWNEPTYYAWSMQQGRNEGLDHLVFLPFTGLAFALSNILQTILYFFALAYFLLHRKDAELQKFVFAIFFVGGFLFHMIWEAGSQYALFYAMGLTVYATLGMLDVCRVVSAWNRTKRIRVGLIVLAAGVVLSVPYIASELTLDRDNVRYAEYMANPY